MTAWDPVLAAAFGLPARASGPPSLLPLWLRAALLGTSYWALLTVGLSLSALAGRRSRLTLPLVVRNRRPGDVFWPQGAGGRMKLKEFLINNKVLRPERDRIPLVFDGEGRLVWVAGYRIAEFCKLTPGTRSVLLLTVSEPGPGVV